MDFQLGKYAKLSANPSDVFKYVLNPTNSQSAKRTMGQIQEIPIIG